LLKLIQIKLNNLPTSLFFEIIYHDKNLNLKYSFKYVEMETLLIVIVLATTDLLKKTKILKLQNNKDDPYTFIRQYFD